VYKPDTKKFVNLTPVSTLPFRGFDKPPPTLEELKTLDPERYSAITQESKRVDDEIAIHIAAIDKEARINAAFKALQEAENARDKAPDAYQQARVNYYTLTKGDSWLDDVKARVAQAEGVPERRRYIRAFAVATQQQNIQQQTQDVMQSVKDGVLSLKDDVQYTTKTFQDQIAKLKNQINIERRGREHPDDDTPFYKWIDAILNLLIIVGLLFAGWTIWRKMSRPRVVAPPVYVPVAPRVQ